MMWPTSWANHTNITPPGNRWLRQLSSSKLLYKCHLDCSTRSKVVLNCAVGCCVADGKGSTTARQKSATAYYLIRLPITSFVPVPMLSSQIHFLILSFTLILHRCNGGSPIEVKGYKFFETDTGKEFLVRGIAYEPRPNSGNLNQNSVDYFTEEHRHIWERDIPILQSLGVNAVRIYAVDPTQNHDAFMCTLNAAGIYVLVSLARDCSTCAVTRDQAPDCYPTALKIQGQKVINAFSKYDNVLGFSAGNEVNHYTPQNNPEWNGPCQKKFLRDMRHYIASCPNMRKVPVGLISADSQRDEVSLYYNCQSSEGDEYEHAEWFGLNVYLSCAGNATNYEDEKGFTGLVDSFQSYDYSIPVMLTEFGCLSKS